MNDPSTHAVPRLLSGRYALEQHLGAGGAGVVWRAHDRLLDRTVAVKLLHGEVAEDPPAAARFRTEASMAAKLTHPNAVIVYDIGHDEGRDYLVMEFVEGATLADVLEAGPLDPGVVAGLGAQVGRALGAAHHRRLVHRDVKPANVLITIEGDAKVADFGIAQALGGTSSRRTAPGQIMGTARYLAPEQLRGEAVDGRADVYALGIVLHEALSGEVPFGEGTMAEVASRRLVVSLPPVSDRRSDVPFSLDDAIARATCLDPQDRFPDGRSFAAELARSSTPGARRALAARLPAQRAEPGVLRDQAAVTADLPADDHRASSATPAPVRIDEPTATMAARAHPPGQSRPEPRPPVEVQPPAHSRAALDAAAGAGDRAALEESAGPGAVAGLDDLDGSGTVAGPVASGDADRPEPVSDRRRPVVAALSALAVLFVGGMGIALIDRPEGTPSQADQLAGDERDTDPADAVTDVVEDDEEEEADDEESDDEESEDEESEDEEPAEVAPAQVVDARDHDPFGSGEEHRADVVNVIDGDDATAWQTQGYRGSPELGGLKSGVGIWLDLGEARQVSEVDITMARSGASFTLYAGAGQPDPGAAPEVWGRSVAQVTDAEQRTRLTLEEPTEGQVWMLWFTSLPRDGSVYRATVSDVRLLSS